MKQINVNQLREIIGAELIISINVSDGICKVKHEEIGVSGELTIFYE